MLNEYIALNKNGVNLTASDVSRLMRKMRATSSYVFHSNGRLSREICQEQTFVVIMSKKIILPELPKSSKNDNDVQKVMSNFLEKAKQQCTTAQQSSTVQIRMLPPSQPKSSAYKDARRQITL